MTITESQILARELRGAKERGATQYISSLKNWKGNKRAFIKKSDGEILSLSELLSYLKDERERNPEQFDKSDWTQPWFGNEYFVPFKNDEETDNGLMYTLVEEPQYQRDWASQGHGTADIPQTKTQTVAQDKTVQNESLPQQNEATEPINPNQKLIISKPSDTQNPGLPNWLRFNVTAQEFEDVVKNNFSDAERLALKRQMYVAGYLGGDEAWAARSVPEDGRYNEDLMNGLKELVADVTKRTYGDTIVSTLNNKIQVESPNLRSVTASRLQVDEGMLALQSYAEKTIKRKLTDVEQKKLLDTVLGFETGAETPQQVVGEVGQGGQLITGGDQNSSALQYGNALARSWGLQPIRGYVSRAERGGLDEAVYQGRSMRIAGAQDYMLAFSTWASNETGQNKLFESVRPVYGDDPNVPDYLEITFNNNVVAPQLTDQSFAYRKDDSRQRFIDSIRRPGEWLAYNWDGNGPAQRGAYLINENTYRSYADLLGIDENDKSVTAQDKIANAYTQDLWDRYKDWDLAAVAFRYGESVAESLKSRGGVEGSSDAELKKWVANVRSSMANWTPRFAPLTMGEEQYGTQGAPRARQSRYGNVIMTPSDFQAATTMQFEKDFAREIKGNAIADGIAWLLRNIQR